MSNEDVKRTENLETPSQVPKSYQDLGVVKGYDPLPPESLRMFILGPPGQGKSTFALSKPNNIVLDFEHGANAIPDSRSFRVPIKNLKHYKDVINQLIIDGQNDAQVFKRFTIDTIDVLADLYITEICEEKGVDSIGEFGSQGAGYNLLKSRLWNDIKALESAGYTWTIVGHMKYKTVTINRQQITKQTPVLYDSVSSIITRNTDFFTMIYREIFTHTPKKKVKLGNGKTVETEGEPVSSFKYYMNLASIDSDNTKSRGVPTMKSKIELPLKDGWQVFSKEYNKAVSETKENLSPVTDKKQEGKKQENKKQEGKK